MSNRKLTEEEILSIHFGLTEIPSEGNIFTSGFIAALRDTRYMSGRDLDTGKIISERKTGSPGSWLGAIGYMILLDQIGSCFKPKTSNEIKGNSIYKTLKYFTNLKDEEINALYAMRCALTHDYCLYNKSSNPQLNHHFKSQ